MPKKQTKQEPFSTVKTDCISVKFLITYNFVKKIVYFLKIRIVTWSYICVYLCADTGYSLEDLPRAMIGWNG